jgi:hypothetical protein
LWRYKMPKSLNFGGKGGPLLGGSTYGTLYTRGYWHTKIEAELRSDTYKKSSVSENFLLQGSSTAMILNMLVCSFLCSCTLYLHHLRWPDARLICANNQIYPRERAKRVNERMNERKYPWQLPLHWQQKRKLDIESHPPLNGFPFLSFQVGRSNR